MCYLINNITFFAAAMNLDLVDGTVQRVITILQDLETFFGGQECSNGYRYCRQVGASRPG